MPDFGGFIIIFLAIVVFYLVFASIKVVAQYEKGLVETFGKYRKTVDPGLNFIIPFAQTITRVDMREQVVDVAPQEVITKDNVAVTVDAVVYYEATDPVKLKYNVANFIVAATKLAQTNLRNIVGELQLDEALTSRELINTQLRQILDDATDKWGTRVVRVEIQRIEPPPDVTQAMHRQMKAERERRAVVTEARARRPQPFCERKVSSSATSCRRKVKPKPSSESPKPTGIRRKPLLKVRQRPSSGFTRPSMTVIRRTTSSPSNILRRSRRSPTATPPKSSCPWRFRESSEASGRSANCSTITDMARPRCRWGRRSTSLPHPHPRTRE